MGKYEAAYDKFNAKDNLTLNIQLEYNGAKQIAPVDDFLTDTSSEVDVQNLYMSTLSSALISHINQKMRMDSENDYALSDFDLYDFITEFDDVINAIRSDEADAKYTEYTHKKFEGLAFDRVANQVWARVAPTFNKPLPTMWKERIRSGSMKIEDMSSITNSFYTQMISFGMDNDAGDKIQFQNELKTIVAAHEAMMQVRETRKGFFGFFWRIFNREQNKAEVNYLRTLQSQIELLRNRDYDIDGVTNEINGNNILSREVFSEAIVKEVEDEGLENKIRLGDQIKNDIEEVSVASTGKIDESPVLTDPNKKLI